MGTKQRREREKQERRRAIVSAARSLFLKKGYDGTTMPEVARAAELAPGTLYLYFPNKDSLYVELLLEGYEILRQRLAKAVDGETEPSSQAGALIESFFAFARECPEYFDIIFFVIQREHLAADWKETFDTSQLLRLESRLNECKAIAASVLKMIYRFSDGSEALTRTVDAVWTMLAGVVFFYRRKSGDVFRSATAEVKALILKGLFGE
jgi:AcrR family transcriptional regulator